MKINWHKKHFSELKKLAGNWIAYEQDGDIIESDKSLLQLKEKLKSYSKKYILYYIHPAHVYEEHPARFLAIYFKTVRKNTWRPIINANITTSTANESFDFLVDSGADFSLVGYETGLALGFSKGNDEKVYDGEVAGGGKIEYLLRDVKITIEEQTFPVTIAWLLAQDCEELLIGRETVFDLFDIEFKQADEEVIFKWRNAQL